jgi:hypothetical protein
MENTVLDVELYDMNTRTKELDFIQNIISRLSARQQDMKNFCLIGLGVLTTLIVNIGYNPLVLLCSLILQLVIINSFYKMDKNFLNSERLYRIWYEFICWKRSHTCQWLFELNPTNIKDILRKESIFYPEFNPECADKKNFKNWSLSIYAPLSGCLLVIHVILICQPFLLRVLSIY